MHKWLTTTWIIAALAFPTFAMAQAQPDEAADEAAAVEADVKAKLADELRALADHQKALAEAQVLFTTRAKTEKAAWLGVSTSRLPESLRHHMKLKSKYVGVLVERIEADSPAAQAGLEQFDIIEKVDDQWIINTQQFGALLRMHAPGDAVAISVIRAGQPRQINAKLIEKELPALAMAGFADIQMAPFALDGVGFGAGVNWFPPAQGGIIIRNGALEPLILDKLRGFSNSQMVIKDDQHTLKLATRDGKRTLTASDANGVVIFEGPLDSEEDLAAVPDEIREKVKNLENAPGAGLPKPDESGPGTRPSDD